MSLPLSTVSTVTLANALAEVFGPATCAGCRRRGTPLCVRCHRRLVGPLNDRVMPGVRRALCAWEYEGAARSLILALKLRRRASAAGPLVDACTSLIARRGLSGNVVTWVPGRSIDIRERGYDHAALLASGIAGRLGLPAVRLLGRIRESIDQTELGAGQRAANLAGVFESRACGEGVVLVDDLVTTGATASACARALKAGGVPRVELVAPCRKS